MKCDLCGKKIGSKEPFYERQEREKRWRKVIFLWRVYRFDMLECLREFAHDPTIGT